MNSNQFTLEDEFAHWRSVFCAHLTSLPGFTSRWRLNMLINPLCLLYTRTMSVLSYVKD